MRVWQRSFPTSLLKSCDETCWLSPHIHCESDHEPDCVHERYAGLDPRNSMRRGYVAVTTNETERDMCVRVGESTERGVLSHLRVGVL